MPPRRGPISRPDTNTATTRRRSRPSADNKHQVRRPQKLAEIKPYHPPRNQEPFDRTQREFHSFRAYKPALHPRREQPRRHTQRKPWRQRQDVLLPGQPPPPPPYHYQQRR